MLRQGPVDKNDDKLNHVKSENLQGDLRHYRKATSTTKNLTPRSRVQVKVNVRQHKILLGIVLDFSLSSFTSVRTPPIPLSSCFHPISMTHLERCTGQTPEHVSNSTRVSQVSNTTGTPLDSILFLRFEAWSHRPPCQAPGLGSFLANYISVAQVDCRNRPVDFQCFGQGLCTNTMIN